MATHSLRSELDRLQTFSENHLESILNVRAGEFRFGQKVQLPQENWEKQLSEVDIVLLGIREDIGVRANLGRPGTSNAFAQALPHLLALQHNDYLNSERVLILGELHFGELMAAAESLNTGHEEDLAHLRQMVSIIDKAVYYFAKKVFDAGKKLIVVGGGHNNCYPLIKALSESAQEGVSVLNFDPHADLRDMEGRHSGNGFTYAWEEKHLQHYHIFGLAESGNNQAIVSRIENNEQISCTTMEELIDEGLHRRYDLLQRACNSLPDNSFGLEIDMDVLTHYPASAVNSSGFNGNELRGLVRYCLRNKSARYVHICEAAPDLANSSAGKSQAANFLARITADVIKTINA
jgi:formiminoglutamase